LYFKLPHFYLLILAEDHALVLSLLDVEVKEDQEEEVGFQCPFLVVMAEEVTEVVVMAEEVTEVEVKVEVMEVEVVMVEVMEAEVKVEVKVEVVKVEAKVEVAKYQ
jgi:hypothetical protein